MRTLTIPDLYTTVHNLYTNDMKTELLCIAVSEIVPAISAVTDMGEQEVIEILASDAVSTVRELEKAIRLHGNSGPVSSIGAARIADVIKRCIVSVARMAEVDPDELAGILSRNAGITTEDIVKWLRAGNRYSET